VKNRAEADADVCTALPEVQPPLLLRSETALHRSVIAQRRKYIFNVFIAVWRLLSVMLTETERSTKAVVSTFRSTSVLSYVVMWHLQ